MVLFLKDEGKLLFIENGGIALLKRFCTNLKISYEKRWDSLMGRSCAILSRCCAKRQLPLCDAASPLTFQMPEEQSSPRNSSKKIRLYYLGLVMLQYASF